LLDFADGDNVNVTVVVTDSDNNEKFVQTATLTVSGKAEIAKTSLFTYTGFNGSREESDDGHVFSKDDVKNITAKDTISFSGYVAFASGKAKKPNAGDFTAYVDGDKTKTYDVTVVPTEQELNNINGVYEVGKLETLGNGEYAFTVGLNSQALKAGKHTLTVEYDDAKLTADFELLADSANNVLSYQLLRDRIHFLSVYKCSNDRCDCFCYPECVPDSGGSYKTAEYKCHRNYDHYISHQ